MMTKSADVRREQLKISQQKRRQKRKGEGKKAILVYLDQETKKLLSDRAQELSSDYAGAIKDLLAQRSGGDDSGDDEKENGYSLDQIEAAVRWISFLYPGTVENETRLLHLLKERIGTC